MAADSSSNTEPLITKESNLGRDVEKNPSKKDSSYNAEAQTEMDSATEKPQFKIWDEIHKQLLLAGPMIGVNLLQTCLQVVSVMFVGHLGELSLASASIATSMATVTGYSVLLGMGSALETFCGQAYGGKQFHLLGVFLQRGLLVLNVTALVISFLWFNMERALLLLRQDATIAAKAGEYMRWLIPGLFAYGSLQCTVKFLQTQGIVLPMLICSLITLLLHIPICYLLVFKVEMGNIGAAMAASLSNWLNLTQLVLYIRFSKTCSKTWISFSREAYRDLKAFIKLAIPSAVMVCLEWWAFELVVILSGTLPNPQLETSTSAICLNTLGLIFMIPFGLGAAVSTRVSNELGAGHPLAAQFAVRVALMLGAIDALFVASLLMSIRKVCGFAFSNELEVVHHVAAMIPLLACLEVMDVIQGVLSGIARGCGWQANAAFANLGAYYICGLPTAILLAFVFRLNLLGLWIGVLCGVSAQMISLLTITLRLDWQTQARKAISQLHTSTRSILS